MSNLDADLAAYLARPVTGEKLPAAYAFDPMLVALLQKLAAERAVSVDALAEFLVFKALKGEHARRLIGEKPEPVPASFANERVARAKIEVAKDVAAVRAGIEERGDRAARIAAQMEAVLADAQGDVPELENVRREALEGEARVDLALEKTRPPKPPKF